MVISQPKLKPILNNYKNHKPTNLALEGKHSDVTAYMSAKTAVANNFPAIAITVLAVAAAAGISLPSLDSSTDSIEARQKAPAAMKKTHRVGRRPNLPAK